MFVFKVTETEEKGKTAEEGETEEEESIGGMLEGSVEEDGVEEGGEGMGR